MAYLTGSRSNFPDGVDKIKEKYDLSPGQLQQADRWYTLKFKDRTDQEEVEFNDLTIALQDFIETPEDRNKFGDMVIKTQKHYRDNTVGHIEKLKQETTDFVEEKKVEMDLHIDTKKTQIDQSQQDMLNYTDNKKQEIDTTVETGQTSINKTKDDALISIENKKENIIEYMDSTTAGAIRNDMGDLKNLTTQQKDNLVLAINEVNAKDIDLTPVNERIDDIEGSGRTTETVKKNADDIKVVAKDIDDRWGRTAKDIAGMDLNDLTESGIYGAYNCINAPRNSVGYLTVIKHYLSGDKYISQSYVGLDSKVHTRLRNNNTWEPWKEIAYKDYIGDKSTLKTTNKSTIVASINELFTNVSDGKRVVATAITDKGVQTSSGDTFDKMATNINAIKVGDYSIGDVMPLNSADFGFYPGSTSIISDKARYSFDRKKNRVFIVEHIDNKIKGTTLLLENGNVRPIVSKVIFTAPSFNDIYIHYCDYDDSIVVSCRDIERGKNEVIKFNTKWDLLWRADTNHARGYEWSSITTSHTGDIYCGFQYIGFKANGVERLTSSGKHVASSHLFYVDDDYFIYQMMFNKADNNRLWMSIGGGLFTCNNNLGDKATEAPADDYSVCILLRYGDDIALIYRISGYQPHTQKGFFISLASTIPYGGGGYGLSFNNRQECIAPYISDLRGLLSIHISETESTATHEKGYFVGYLSDRGAREKCFYKINTNTLDNGSVTSGYKSDNTSLNFKSEMFLDNHNNLYGHVSSRFVGFQQGYKIIGGK